MMDHETLRHLADTWGLVFLVLTFVVAVAMLFRPGAGSHYRKCAELPLKDDQKPDVREPGK